MSPEPVPGLPDDGKVPVDQKIIDELHAAKRDLQAAVRGDDEWRHPDLVRRGQEGDMFEGPDWEEGGPEGEEVNMAAPTPEIYKHAHAFMSAVFGDENYTPDSIGQLVDVFVPCLRIMVERPYEPRGALWRKAGIFGPLQDVRKKFDRFWYRTWTCGIRHDDSGFDMINFAGFTLRSEPDSRFGELGEPAPPRTEPES